MAKAAARELLPGQKRFGAGPLAADIGADRWFIFSLFPIVVDDAAGAEERRSSRPPPTSSSAPRGRTSRRWSPTRATDLTSVDFKTSLLTSLINCGGAVIVSLVIGIPAAYAAGRWKYRGSDDLMFQMLSFRFAPGADGDRAAVRDLQPDRACSTPKSA